MLSLVLGLEQGLVQAIQAATDVQPPILATWRGISAGLQLSESRKGRSQEHDSTGTYEAQYRQISANEVVREKTKYVELLGTGADFSPS